MSLTRARVPFARIVTPDLTYVKYGLRIEDSIASIEDQRRDPVRQLTGIELSFVDEGGRERVAGLNEQGDPEVWTWDRRNCGCGGLKIEPTSADEVPT